MRTLLSEALILLHGRPTAQDTWFPGYHWQSASCAHCYTHLGWLFTQYDTPWVDRVLQPFVEFLGYITNDMNNVNYNGNNSVNGSGGDNIRVVNNSIGDENNSGSISSGVNHESNGSSGAVERVKQFW